MENPPNGLTPEELAEKLKNLGVDLGSWGEVEEKVVPPVAMGRKAALLLQLQGMLQGIADQDQEQVLVLREKIARLQHGGGQ